MKRVFTKKFLNYDDPYYWSWAKRPVETHGCASRYCANTKMHGCAFRYCTNTKKDAQPCVSTAPMLQIP